MQIFISWSGERSKLVGLLLRDWIKCVLQVSKPWMSDVDIDRGSVWFSEIGKALDGCVNGIICLTRGNLLKPWLLFEAGALAKGLTSSRVFTLLVDVQPSDVGEPLSQFNHTLPNEDGIRKLLITLNSRLVDSALANDTLSKVFNTYWPQFNDKFQEIIKGTDEEKLPTRSEKDVLGEVLSTIRRIDKRLSSVEGVIGDFDFDMNRNISNYSGINSSYSESIDNGDYIAEYIINSHKKGMTVNRIVESLRRKFNLSMYDAEKYVLSAKNIMNNMQNDTP